MIALKIEDSPLRTFPAKIITGHWEVLGRPSDRRDSFTRHFREISGKYPGETRRARRILARAAMKNEWKDRVTA